MISVLSACCCGSDPPPSQGAVAAVEALIKSGATPGAVDRYGNTALVDAERGRGRHFASVVKARPFPLSRFAAFLSVFRAPSTKPPIQSPLVPFHQTHFLLHAGAQVLQECGVAGTVNRWTGSAVKASIVGSLPEIFNRYSTFTYVETWVPVREGNEVRVAPHRLASAPAHCVAFRVFAFLVRWRVFRNILGASTPELILSSLLHVNDRPLCTPRPPPRAPRAPRPPRLPPCLPACLRA